MANPTTIPYAELHAHTNFSFLDGASPPDELVARAVELGLTGLAATDHNGLYGAVRFIGAANEAGSTRWSASRSSCGTPRHRIPTRWSWPRAAVAGPPPAVPSPPPDPRPVAGP